MRRSLRPVVLTASLLAGCGGGATSSSQLSAQVGFRMVKADVDGPAAITTSEANATIKAGNRVIIVEPTRVLIDGTPRAQLPADAKVVQVTVREGQTTISADGQPAPEP